jgi:plasmid stability protein
MADIFAVRNLDEKTRKEINAYANEHNSTIAEAIRELVFLALQHIKHTKKEKKYKSIFDTQDKIAFHSGDPNLSKNIDKILYGEKQ